MSKGLASVLESIEKISLGPVQFDFLEKEDQENFLKELIRLDEDTFIVVDEQTLFLAILSMCEDRTEKVDFILNWLRSLLRVSKTKVRWLFCGFVGLKILK